MLLSINNLLILEGNSQSHQAASAVPSITIATTISVLLGYVLLDKVFC